MKGGETRLRGSNPQGGAQAPLTLRRPPSALGGRAVLRLGQSKPPSGQGRGSHPQIRRSLPLRRRRHAHATPFGSVSVSFETDSYQTRFAVRSDGTVQVGSGITGALRRGIQGLLLTHYATPHTKFLTVPPCPGGDRRLGRGLQPGEAALIPWIRDLSGLRR